MNKPKPFKHLPPVDHSANAWRAVLDREAKRHAEELEEYHQRYGPTKDAPCVRGIPYSYAELLESNKHLASELEKKTPPTSRRHNEMNTRDGCVCDECVAHVAHGLRWFLVGCFVGALALCAVMAVCT